MEKRSERGEAKDMGKETVGEKAGIEFQEVNGDLEFAFHGATPLFCLRIPTTETCGGLLGDIGERIRIEAALESPGEILIRLRMPEKGAAPWLYEIFQRWGAEWWECPDLMCDEEEAPPNRAC